LTFVRNVSVIISLKADFAGEKYLSTVQEIAFIRRVAECELEHAKADLIARTAGGTLLGDQMLEIHLTDSTPRVVIGAKETKCNTGATDDWVDMFTEAEAQEDTRLVVRLVLPFPQLLPSNTAFCWVNRPDWIHVLLHS
jgi:hypothetical protein